MDRATAIRTALGREQADLVLRGAKVVDVYTGAVFCGDVAIRDGIIAGVGRYENAQAVVDLAGRYLVPGFLNTHCHVESSMVTPQRYCREELRHGVTTLITDPHEIANVAGLDGIRYMLDASEGARVNYYVQLPSCVPATPFEHAGAVLPAEKLLELKHHPRVLGLGEMMNYPGVLGCDPEVLAKLDAFSEMAIDGHAPDLTGNALQAYAGAGMRTDHESLTWETAREKLRAGVAVLVREGSACRDLTAILTGALAEGACTQRMAFCTDDKHLADIHREGTIRHNMEMAVELGMNGVEAVQMATINAAQIFGLKNLGAVAPGYCADLVVLEDLIKFRVLAVYKDGVCAVRDGELCEAEGPVTEAGAICSSVHLPKLHADSFALPERAVQPVIRILPGQVVTAREELPGNQVSAALADGRVRKIAVVERHHAIGSVGVGLLRATA